MKFTCFIDACSYIYLTQEDYYVTGKTLLQLLGEHVHLKYSNEVYNEIARHSNDRMLSSLGRSSAVYRLNTQGIKTYVEYEKRLFGVSSTRDESNRGEKHNLVAIIDHYLHERSRSLIFLTDDKKAVNHTIKDVLHSFPIYHVWSSFDVVLFLYLEAKGFGLDFAKSAIKDINAFLANNMSSGTRHEITEERIRTFKLYTTRLDQISKIKVKKI